MIDARTRRAADQLPVYKVQVLYGYYGWTAEEFQRYAEERQDVAQRGYLPLLPHPCQDLSYNPLAKKESTR